MARRNKTTNVAGTDTPPGMHAPARGKTTRGTVPLADIQYLSAPKINTSIGDRPITAQQLTGFVNTVCGLEAREPGFVAANPSWLYDLGLTMFGGGVANI